MRAEKFSKKYEMDGESQTLLGKEDSDVYEKVNSPRKEEEELDGGWGWLVVFACFLTTFVLDGIGYSFGIFMEPLKLEMDEGNFGVASIGSIQVRVLDVFILLNL